MLGIEIHVMNISKVGLLAICITGILLPNSSELWALEIKGGLFENKYEPPPPHPP